MDDQFNIEDILNTDQELYNQDIELDGISFNNSPDLENDIDNDIEDLDKDLDKDKDLDDDLMVQYKKYKDMSIRELKDIISTINNSEDKKISISGNKTKLIQRIIENIN